MAALGSDEVQLTFFVETSASTPVMPIEGVLYEGGLPGPTRDSFIAEGAIGSTHWKLSPWPLTGLTMG